MVERRSAKRYSVAYPIETDADGELSGVDMIDVSTNGVAFAARSEIKKDLGFEIKLFLKSRMFKMKAMVVHARQLKEDAYNIGACFIDPPKEFIPLLEKEIQEIIQNQRARRLYEHDDISLIHASREYLET
jgi:hypothetical protein